MPVLQFCRMCNNIAIQYALDLQKYAFYNMFTKIYIIDPKYTWKFHIFSNVSSEYFTLTTVLRFIQDELLK